ncbi:MAG TPA: hypothetical protein VF731_01320 [Solirubrobacterales bacterium]
MLLFVGVAAAVGAIASSALANQLKGHPCPPPEPHGHRACTPAFTLKGTNGYTITAYGDPRRTAPDQVQVWVRGPHENNSYVADGLVTKTRIEASLGELGEIDLRFKPSGRIRRVRSPHCGAQVPPFATAALGTFVGTFRFRGEGGYTEALTHRVRGDLGGLEATTTSPKCESHPSAAEAQEEEEAVGLDAFAPGGWSFVATRELIMAPSWIRGSWPPPSGRDSYLFMVLGGETRGPVDVTRLVAAIGPAGDFSLDSALASATVTPPPPFSGTGTLQHNADGSTSWTGSLSVQIAGLGSVPLAGTGSKAELK